MQVMLYGSFFVPQVREDGKSRFHLIMVIRQDFRHGANGSPVRDRKGIQAPGIHPGKGYPFRRFHPGIVRPPDPGFLPFHAEQDGASHLAAVDLMQGMTAGVQRDCDPFPFGERIRDAYDIREGRIDRSLDLHESGIQWDGNTL